MTELLTAAQMRAIEQAAIDSGEVTGLELMERAGRGVVEAIFEEWPELAVGEEAGQGGSAPHPSDSPRGISGKKKRAVVLCGPGNNGGDGFVVARLLHECGWEVEVFLYGDADKLPPDARVNYERWAEIEGIRPHDQMSDESFTSVDISIDGLFGTGLSRNLEIDAQYALTLLSEVPDGSTPRKPPIVAIDIPSGFDADSGRILRNRKYPEAYPNYWPDLTVTFERPRIGHFLNPCADHMSFNATDSQHAGGLSVKSIGLEQLVNDWSRTADPVWSICLGQDWFLSHQLEKEVTNHKFSHGHALILTGGFGKTGAARLAGRGALRIGAGLVTLGVPPSARMEVASTVTAIMQARVSEGQELATLLQDARLNALCLGPGMGVERARELVPVALLAKRATVLDADALTAFADAPQTLFDLLHENCVLTPHGGEFARLFPDVAEKLNAPATKGPAYSKVDATREAAARAGCVVLFKGPDTVIAAPDGRCSISSAHYDRSAPWLATAGSGDVLAGFVTGLLARGFLPMQAAETAAWLHVECALEFGPGLIAEDLPEMLPKVFRKIGA
ncbi:NAD(P)H-hydrate dehydratase [Aliiroseovarius crassostreae]|uniref:NAD(P)H-hydrate dehydratase n=1 Tax=Aliiroseovarius crassostreae TaxID=154981 RepID=UPI0021AEB419|nr:NAD(P)H-hydrate dehydratase [Aliiroseovarius crassostreae]UWQ06245.1 NAD(P)H-hydrate dehydratase [Aliiroseovarius crassostreae]